jgi:A/G-specific adenine glycosylase
MTRIESIALARLRKSLLRWYDQHARRLPWRGSRDPYRVWVSEIMLQQTQVATVRPYYTRFLKEFSTVQQLAKAPLQRVLKVWEGLGYYSRARCLWRAARAIARAGSFPESAAEWKTIPGVGEYTAAAIASITRDEIVGVLDGNVKRVLARRFGIRAEISKPRTLDRLRRLSQVLVDPGRPGDFNQAMMELGAVVCRPTQPACASCPWQTDCVANARSWQSRLPVKTAAAPRPHHQVVAAVIRRQGRLLVGQRPPRGLLGGLWEFPGGKVEPGETLEQAVERELHEECNLVVRAEKRLGSVRHDYTHLAITLHGLECRILRGRLRANFHDRLRWVTFVQLTRLPLPKANLKLLPWLVTLRTRAGG